MKIFLLLMVINPIFCDNPTGIKYSKAKALPSGKIFVTYHEGINIYNSDSSLNTSLINFNSDKKIDGNSDYNKKTRVEEYSDNENFYILSLIKGSYLYIYDYKNNFLIEDITLSLESGNYYNLIVYKLEDNNLFYIISFVKDNQINFYLYMVNLSSSIHENTKLNNSQSNNQLEEDYFSCNIIDMNEVSKKREVLACYYLVKISGFKLQASIFDIDNNFKEIKNTNWSFHKVKKITSSSGDKKNSLVCFQENNNLINCKIYNMDENNFKYINIETSKYDSFEEYYFSATNQYSLIYYDNEYKNFKLYILNENFSKYKVDLTSQISNCEEIKGFSFVYSKENQEYILIYNCKKNGNNWELIFQHSIKVNMTNNKDNISPSSTNFFTSDTISSYNINNNPTTIPSIISDNIESTLLYNSYSSLPESSIISSNPNSHFTLLISSLPFNPPSSLLNNNPSTDIFSQNFISNTINTEFHTIIIDSTISYSIPNENKIIQKNLEVNKEEFIENLKEIIEEIEIGTNYEMKGEDFNLIIKPTNSTYLDNTTHVNFSKCEEILRQKLNISSSRILTFLQLEIDNNNEKSLVNQVEYQVYDDNKTLLDLSLCNDTNIKIFYLLKNNMINLDSISSFSESGVDVFDINDSFFNDICESYSDYSKNDVILKDRIKYIYQNYSLCDNGCTYNEFNITINTISCDCQVKNNLSSNESSIYLEQLDNIKLDSNFDIIKCYNLVFSLKDKLYNIGFWIFLVINILHLPLLFIYCNKGIEPIKDYILKEMEKYGYIKGKKGKNKNRKLKHSSTQSVKLRKKSSKKNIFNAPPKKIRTKKKVKTNNLINSSSLNSMKLDKDIINNINENISKLGNFSKDNNDNNIIKKSIKNTKNKRINKKLFLTSKTINIENLPTKGLYINKSKNKNIGKKNNIFNLCLININLNNIKEYKPRDSNLVLNNYTFEEAKRYDRRSICLTFYIFLLSKQPAFHAFLFKSPLELFPLRLCLLLFIFSSDLALNAFFYLDDKISKKYIHAQNLFLFTFNNNITIILLSTLIGFLFMTLFTNLSNASNSIRNIFRKEEEKIKKNNKYKVNIKRKNEIVNEIENILKKYKIKVCILLIIEISLILFFWYYVTAFCHVYSNTQFSWLLDSFLSILSRLIIELLLSLGFAKLYRMAVEAEVKCLYNIVLFFYCFG